MEVWAHDTDDWPNCSTPDCQYKSCVWAGTGLCCPCSIQLIGKEELNRRYVATHPEEKELEL